MIKVKELQAFLGGLKPEEELRLELDCFNGWAYLHTRNRKEYNTRVNLATGIIEGWDSGRITSAKGSIMEIDRSK